MQERVAVTGPDGFVGRHLSGILGDRLLPIRADVGDPEALADAVADAAPDAVVHLAARSSVGASWDGAAVVWQTNAVGTVALLEAVRRAAPRARVLAVSTSEVYGANAAEPAGEDAPTAPVSPYAASKLAAEIACERARRADGLDVVVARPFQHAGPGQDERFAIGSWAAQIARLEADGGGDLLVGDIDVRRDLADVRDVCRAYVALLDHPAPAPRYVVASGTAVPLRDVVDALVARAAVPIRVVQDPARLRRSDVRVLVGDARRLRDDTGWRPQIPLDQTLADTLAAARAARADPSRRP